MNRSNGVKLVIAVLLIGVVAIATISYGNSQRKKVANNDPTQSSLPTIQDSQKENNNPSKPGDSQPSEQKPSEQKPTTQPDAKPTVNNAPANQSVQPQLPQGRTPATGPADNIIPVAILGSMSGLYLVSRRRVSNLIKL